MYTMWCIGRCIVLCMRKFRRFKGGWGINVLFVVVVGESASSLGETEGFVWKVSASCHQHICMTSRRYVCLRGLSRPEHALVIQGGSLGGVGMVE